MPLYIFIDSSIYLSFFSASNDDLEQLSKISTLVRSRVINLIIPAQVCREVRRNRDNKLLASLTDFEKHNIKLPPIPRFMSDYEEIKSLRSHLDAAIKARNAAAARSKMEASKVATRADLVIDEIFGAAGIIEDNDELFARAQRRMLLGDPPGKADSLGDRLNWECILEYCPKRSDVFILTKDNDYLSPLNETMPNNSLALEWRSKRMGNLYTHTEIKRFLASKFREFNFKLGEFVSDSKTRLRSSDEFEILRLNIRSAELKNEVLSRLKDAKDEEELLEAIEFYQSNKSYLGNLDYKKIIEISLSSSTFDYNGYTDEVRDFIASIIPNVFGMLSTNEIANLEHTFGIEIEKPNYDDEPDLFMPNYNEMELQELEKLADDDADFDPTSDV